MNDVTTWIAVIGGIVTIVGGISAVIRWLLIRLNQSQSSYENQYSSFPNKSTQPYLPGSTVPPAGYGYPAVPSQYPGMQPGYPQPYGVPVLPDQNGGEAIAGLVLGSISMLAWLLPICGLPFAIVGIILSVVGRKSVSRRTMATFGLVLSIIGLVLTIVDFAIGVYLQIQHPTSLILR